MPGTLGNASPYNTEASPGGLLKRFVSFPTFDGGVDSYSALSEPKAAWFAEVDNNPWTVLLRTNLLHEGRRLLDLITD